MKSDADKLLENIIRALHDFYVGLGQPAWLLLGAFLVAGLLIGGVLLRWIYRGGLARRSISRLTINKTRASV